MNEYGRRIRSVLDRIVTAADVGRGSRGYNFIAERELPTAYESAWRVPAGYSAANVRRVKVQLEAICGAPVEVDDRGGVVVLRVVTDDLPAYIPIVAGDLRPDALLIGYDRLRAPVYHPLHSHLLAGGASGAGKTDWLRFVVYQLLLQKYDVRIVDMKGFSFMPFEGAPGISVARNLSEAVSMLAGSYNNLLWREEEVIRSRHRGIIETFRPLAVVIDEAAQIAPKQNSGKDREVAKLCDEYCAKIAQKGREPRVSLIYCTQRPDSDVINPQVKANVEAAIAFRCKTRTNSEIILDHAGAERIKPATPGRAIYSAAVDTLIQAPFVGGDNEWIELLRPLKIEVIYEGHSARSDIRRVQDASYTEQPSPSSTVLRPWEPRETRIRSIEGTGVREIDSRPEARRYDASMAADGTWQVDHGDTAEVDIDEFE